MNRNIFLNKKKNALEKLNAALKENKVDLEVLDLINLINKSDYFYTTSSCAGRIVILSKDSFRGKYSAQFLFKKHGTSSFEEINEVLSKKAQFYLLYFNVEPPTFHIAANTIDDGIFIHQLALEAGLGYSMFKSVKKSIIIEIRGTGLLQMPIGMNNNLLIDLTYFKFVLEQGNEILSQEQERLTRFRNLLENSEI